MGQIGNRLGVSRMVNRPQGGGDKLAGLAPTATGQMLSMPFAWRAAMGGLANGCAGGGAGRANGGYACGKMVKISTTNQLGGIGRKRSMTFPPADGVNKKLIKSKVAAMNKMFAMNTGVKIGIGDKSNLLEINLLIF